MTTLGTVKGKEYVPHYDEEFARRFQRAISESKLRDMTQDEIGKVFGYSRQAISFFMAGTRYPNIKTAIEICKKLDISIDWLYLGKGAMRLGDSGQYALLSERIMDLSDDGKQTIGLVLGMMEKKVLEPSTIRTIINQHLSIDMGSFSK